MDGDVHHIQSSHRPHQSYMININTFQLTENHCLTDLFRKNQNDRHHESHWYVTTDRSSFRGVAKIEFFPL